LSGCLYHFFPDLCGTQVADAAGMGVVYFLFGLVRAVFYFMPHLSVCFAEREEAASQTKTGVKNRLTECEI
jgi:Na+-transporting methylmalonyl-CoA/oxaloacetate decarboxylase gamma subunit